MNYLEMKKRAFMSIVNAVKGFVRTISGIPPITLPDCVDEDSLINYTISGNSVQNGEPTPENPVEVESVGDLTTKNIFNYRRYCEEWEAASPYGTGVYSSKPDIMYLNEDCFSIVAYHAGLRFMDGEFKENTQYTFNFSIAAYREGYTGVAFAPICIFYTDGTHTAISRSMYPDRFIDIQFTTDANKTVKYMQVANYTPAARLYFKKTFQIEEGITASEYEPYRKYKIPILCGQSLDYVKYKKGYFINSLGVETASNGYSCSEDYIPVLPNATYRIVCENGNPISNYYLTMPFYDSNKNFISRTSFGAFAEVPKIGEFTTPDNCYYIRFSLPNAYSYDVSLYNLDNAINIYLDEPLRKAGDYADYIDFEKQKVVRKIHKWMFKDNIVIDYYSDRMPSTQQWTTCCISLGFKNMATGLKNKLTNHFKNSGNSAAHMASLATHGIFSGHSTNNRIYFDLGDSKSIYNADNPITNWEHWEDAYVIGKLETPTETDIVLPKLPTTKGTTIYTIETSIQPSNMSAEYYSTSKGSDENVI